MFENEICPQRAMLVSLDTGEYDAEVSLAELEELTRTAGAEPALTLTQKRPAPETATCIGSGMVEQAAELCSQQEIDLLIFDRELTPTQIRNLEKPCPGWAAALALGAPARQSWRPTGGISGGGSAA